MYLFDTLVWVMFQKFEKPTAIVRVLLKWTVTFFFVIVLMVKLNLFLLFRRSTMNQEKLAKLQAQVRIGGKVRKPPEMLLKT